MTTSDELAVVGRVRKAHGIRGELMVEPYTNEPAAVFAAGRRLFGGSPDGRLVIDALGAARALTVRRSSPFKEGLIVQVDELADRTAAEAWRERTLLARLAELPPPGEDEVYLHELVGMQVVRVDGSVLGEVVDYFELPHELLLEVRVPPATDAEGAEGATPARRDDTVLLPYRPEVVTEVDTVERRITADPPEGLFG